MILIDVEVIYDRKRLLFLMLDKSDKQFPFRKNEIMPSYLKNVFKNKIKNKLLKQQQKKLNLLPFKHVIKP